MRHFSVSLTSVKSIHGEGDELREERRTLQAVNPSLSLSPTYSTMGRHPSLTSLTPHQTSAIWSPVLQRWPPFPLKEKMEKKPSWEPLSSRMLIGVH